MWVVLFFFVPMIGCPPSNWGGSHWTTQESSPTLRILGAWGGSGTSGRETMLNFNWCFMSLQYVVVCSFDFEPYPQLWRWYLPCPPQQGFWPQQSRFPRPASRLPPWWRYSGPWWSPRGSSRLHLQGPDDNKQREVTGSPGNLSLLHIVQVKMMVE